MPYDSPTIFYVDVQSDPVVIKIVGRANYLNSLSLDAFFNKMLDSGALHFALDFGECLSMDSTFLGLITGMAMRLSEKNANGNITLYRLSERNLELIRNMGLHRIFNVQTGDIAIKYPSTLQELRTQPLERDSMSGLVRKAHRSLVALDSSNQKIFEDVLYFLKEDESGHS